MKEEKFEKKLLLEGKDDLHFIANLCQSISLPENFDVIDCKSCDGVFKQLELRLSNPKMNRVLGLVLDADAKNPTDRLLSLKNRLNKDIASIFPDIMPEDGLVVTPADRKRFPIIGLWIMPDNIHHGMLEDFVMKLIPNNDLLISKAEEIVTDIERISPRPAGRFKDVHRSKAKVHSYLAWKDEPGVPMGQAITKGILDPHSESANKFVDWLSRLFN